MISDKMRAHYDRVWKQDDPWAFESSEFEQLRYLHELAILEGRHYPKTLEIGCGAGRFTRLLARISDRIIAVDIAPSAIERAVSQGDEAGKIDYRAADVMKFDVVQEGPWDLVVMSETIYSLGWLYPFFDIGWLARQLFAATSINGRLLLANTYGGEKDHLLSPWLIHTYRDLFRNVGYQIESEELFEGTKEGVPMKVLMSLFIKPPGDEV